MSGFSAEWLRLREPHDAAARNAELVAFLPSRSNTARTIVDLGCGTGANLRYLAPLLGMHQTWLLVDDDGAVLDAVPRELEAWARTHGFAWRALDGDGEPLQGPGFSCDVRRQRLDLAHALDALPIAERALVTASALLDLVSADWLNALVRRCRAAQADVLFALTYDGRMSADPADEDDELVRELVNEHQHTDKGFGAALGPDAPQAAAHAFALFGYEVRTAASDWRIPPDARALQHALIDGWYSAAAAIAPKRTVALARWRRRRRAHVERGASTLTVGHVDLAARLP